MIGLLRIIYEKWADIPSYIIESANCYEGLIPHRIGLNFPACFLPQSVQDCHPGIQYVIVYPRRDPSHVRQHEENHARYFFDEMYRKKVHREWSRLPTHIQRKWKKYYQSLGYPEHVWIDEWQADQASNASSNSSSS